MRVQADSMPVPDGDHAETAQRLDPLVLLYLFLVFLLGATLQSSENFVHCSHWNPLPPVDSTALQVYPLRAPALLATNLPLDRITGLRHQDPSEGVDQFI